MIKNKRVLLLSDPSSAHTVKWANGLADAGVVICVFGFSNNPDLNQYKKNIIVINNNISKDIKSKQDGAFQKIIYLKFLFSLYKIIHEFKPDIIHAHYATSYGLLGVLSFFHPLVLSVWGSDINDFPNKNIIYKYLLKFIFLKVDYLCATSLDLAKKTQLFTKKHINIIPFGIDLSVFNTVDKPSKINYIGIVKTLEPNYGIEYLIRAYAQIRKIRPSFEHKLLIVGGGSQLLNLKQLAKNLYLDEFIEFTGYINYNEVHNYHKKLLIGIYPSFKESFGVAIAETMACGGAVVASNVDGIKEIVEMNKTGFLFEPKDIDAIAKYVLKLVDDKNLYDMFVNNGKKVIEQKYSLDFTINEMLKVYKNIIKEC